MGESLIDRIGKQAPVALMFRSLFSRLFSAAVLDKIFAQHRQRQVEGTLLFSSLIRLLAPVVGGSVRSVCASYNNSNVEVSSQAVYDKLKGVEPQVSAALVRSTVDELRLVQEKAGALKEDIIPGYHAFVIDGKTYNATEHRLRETRSDSRAPMPGRAIAMLDTRYELFVDVECDAQAFRCERKILVPMTDRLQPGALYLADRNFSDGPVLARFLDAKTYFIVRQHGACPSWRPVSEVRHSKHKDEHGGAISERQVEIKLPDGSWCRMRQVTVTLSKATRKGDKELTLLTNLPRSVTAAKIATAYRKRWTIETCLGYLAQTLNAEINTLCYPGAAGLCFCLALTLFNIMSTIKSLLEAHGQRPKKRPDFDLSYYYLAQEIARCHAGMEIAIRPGHWNRYPKMKSGAFVEFLTSLAKHAQLKRYRKSVRGPKKKPPKRKYTGARHVATQRLLDDRMTA